MVKSASARFPTASYDHVVLSGPKLRANQLVQGIVPERSRNSGHRFLLCGSPLHRGCRKCRPAGSARH